VTPPIPPNYLVLIIIIIIIIIFIIITKPLTTKCSLKTALSETHKAKPNRLIHAMSGG